MYRAVVLEGTRMSRVSKCWLSSFPDRRGALWPTLLLAQHRFILIPLLVGLYPRESCPLLEPSASIACLHVVQIIAQLCDKMPSEKVMFSSVLVSKTFISVISSQVSLLRILGQSRRCSLFHCSVHLPRWSSLILILFVTKMPNSLNSVH